MNETKKEKEFGSSKTLATVECGQKGETRLQTSAAPSRIGLNNAANLDTETKKKKNVSNRTSK